MSNAMAWLCLLAAGLLEICWAIGLKYAEGFTKLWPSIFTLVTLALSTYLLAKSASVLPIGTAYAVWVGIGAMGTAIFGIFLLQEPVTVMRIFFLLMLFVSIIGIKLSAPTGM